MRWACVALLLTAAIAWPQDAQLHALHETLARLRAQSGAANAVQPSPGPELTTAKHQLRDWIETQLASFNDTDDAKLFSARINAALKPIGVAVPDDDQNLIGQLGHVRVENEPGMLIVTTGAGIICQLDESAYGYKRADGRWRRVWESEQNDYSAKYAPQQIIAVHTSQAFQNGHERGPAYVMTLGNSWGCGSFWHSVYYRVWRVDSSGSKLLIDGSGAAWLRTNTYAVGSIGQERTNDNAPAGVLIEWTQGSIDATVQNREAVRHFLIDGDHVRRADPVALSPRDFADEWLTSDWKESAEWAASPALREWHAKLHAGFISGDFGEPTMHCRAPDLWQVKFEPHDAEKNFAPEPTVYFLVRWRPPYHFTMAAISANPWPTCTQKDPGADAWRTLFNTQGWRW